MSAGFIKNTSDAKRPRMSLIGHRKGIVFSVIAALFVVVIFAILIIRIEQTREHGEAIVYRVRCDELSSFLDDITKDLQRATTISGIRAATFAIDIAVNGTPLQEADKTLSELTLNASLNGTKVTALQNQTLENWTEKIKTLALQRDFDLNLDVSKMELDSVPNGPFDFAIRVRIKDLNVTDKFGYCSFDGNLPRDRKYVRANISIEGYEDPVYFLRSRGYVSRAFKPHTTPLGQHGDSAVIEIDILNKYYHPSKDGPSFFERLENKLGSPVDNSRHDYYVNKAYNALIEDGFSIALVNVTIGSETFVDVAELQARIPQSVQSLVIKENQSVVDHLYYATDAYKGKKMIEVSNKYTWFRIENNIDTNHSGYYNISDQQLYE